MESAMNVNSVISKSSHLFAPYVPFCEQGAVS